MHAVASGPVSVPIGEQLLWRGSPDPGRLIRRWLRSSAGGAVLQLVGLAVFLMVAGVFMQFGSSVLWIIGPFALVSVVPLLRQYGRARREARTTSYLLTDQRVLTDGPNGRTDLRLINLPDLRLELHGDGYGSILFTAPLGAGPERYMQRLARWIPQLDDATELLVCIPDAERVMGMLRRAQADVLGARSSGAASSPFVQTPAQVQPEAPVARQSFMRSAAIVPFWFGAAFLIAGLGLLLVVAVSIVSGGTSWAPAIVAGPFALIGALFIRARYLFVRDQRRLRRAAVRVTARVVDVAGTGTQINDVEQWIVRYRFEVRGVEHTGESAMLPWVSVARYAAGDAVEVAYDPDDPSISTLPELEGS